MSRWFPTALAALALLVALWNAWQIGRVDARLSAFEEVGPPPSAARAGDAPRARPPLGEGGLPAKPPFDPDDPEVRERLMAAFDDRAERIRETVREEVGRFADEEGLDGPTIEAVLAELDRRSVETDAIRADLKEGAITRTEAREEIDALRADSDAVLEELLGRARFDRLSARLFGDRGGPPGGP